MNYFFFKFQIKQVEIETPISKHNGSEQLFARYFNPLLAG